MFNVSILLVHNTLKSLQTTSPFIDSSVNHALWQCVPLQHYCLLQLINGVELPAVVDSLLQSPQIA